MIFKNSQQCGSEQGKWRGKGNIYKTSYNKHYLKKNNLTTVKKIKQFL